MGLEHWILEEQGQSCFEKANFVLRIPWRRCFRKHRQLLESFESFFAFFGSGKKVNCKMRVSMSRCDLMVPASRLSTGKRTMIAISKWRGINLASSPFSRFRKLYFPPGASRRGIVAAKPRRVKNVGWSITGYMAHLLSPEVLFEKKMFHEFVIHRWKAMTLLFPMV